MTNNNSII